MKNVVLYLKSRIKVIVMLVVIAIVQFVVFYLYSVPVAPVIYSLELLSFMLAVAVVFDYMAFYRRHKALKHSLLCDEIFQVELYDTSDAIEDDYQQLLTKVLTQKYQANELREKSMADLRDYYAIWAHQIKTPISAIDVLLQAENEPDKIDLKELKRQLFNIDFYVDAVMNYLRLEDMSSDYVFEDCQVEKIVRKAVKKFAAQFIGKSSPNLCVNSSFSYVVLPTLLLSSRDLTEWSLVYHNTLSYQRFYDLHSIHYDHLEGLHQLI